MEKVNRVEKAQEIIDTINNRWKELAELFYVCYSVKELAYRTASKIYQEYYGDNIEDICTTIYCKKTKDKFKIAIPFEYDIYFIFDIYWVTSMYGDSGLHISNGQIYGELPKGYEDIEYVLEDNEEE